VTLATYQGPSYDSRPLHEARGLKETAQQIFPDLDPEQARLLQEELDRIAEEEVAREWEKIEYYLRKDQPASVALHCNYLLHHYPNSHYAGQARQLLAQLERDGVMVNPIGTGAPQGVPAGPQAAPPEEDRNWWPNFLRRSEEPPELAPPPQPLDDAPPEQAPAPVPVLPAPGRSTL
jgi:hypothetical protein